MKNKHLLPRLFFLFFLLVVLAACGKQQVKTKTFAGEVNGVETVLVYKYIQDKVIEQKTTNQLPYSYMKVKNKEEAKAFFEPFLSQYQGIKGLDHSIVYKEDYLIEELTINYEVVSFDEIVELTGMHLTGDPEKGISMKLSEKLINDAGYYKLQK